MSGGIEAVVLDWAGTAVDFGSMAPVDAFLKAFSRYGVKPTAEEIRAPMGLNKRAHIRRMLEGGRLRGLWEEVHGGPPTEEDAARIYEAFEPALLPLLEKRAAPIPGVPEAAEALRKMGVRIGSTTGYTARMMELVAPAAKALGYAPDCLVCPEETGGFGRPYPYMLWRNLEKLRVSSARSAIKVGDTAADIEEGAAAGCVTVGILKGSSMLGLNETEYACLPYAECKRLCEEARKRYFAAGATYVLDTIATLPALIETLRA